ncbi:acetyl-CoA/propionyl-CoA carboxylase biotin carboxyl carrier protein [Thermocatellispora tengchongensis]|uniref:Biotin-dependent 3-methylcrotonyl-coenzyme A carboxylase alpha1 subunit n=1 Tax=Thermocatellispora tengchongensis TaxID=1073253 RepID=A0A840NYA6_9ACTN|nr:biotin carboxylase N-terminal domain-containing protein [Thermocatellispora tengchongensis]MBB5131196.1 acetyl-CoA/propionyl-CoA carboxylase biotin carboxyl carrier protein [Thermocatellispora tengchongensis]
MFDTVLIANRGEIAVRVARTLRRLGIRSVAVHTEADAGAAHVRAADVAVAVPGYLDMDAVIAACRATGAQAVHPGYGFLAENAAFARRCAEAGVVFVGPPPAAIEAMGDKIRAKATVSKAGVPVVPGLAEPDDDLAETAARVGFPALIKPSAGGGGKGMLLVRAEDELAAAIESARRTALAAFGDGTLLVERFVTNPRHIEIQVLADAYGNVVHLGERECSLQRRHQKIVEEAPSPLLDPETRAKMGAAAVEAARSVGYVGAGTVEFIVHGETREHYFMEMNTRLQVEHPVTEMITGLDLVELQLLVAAGGLLPFAQEEVRLDGHAVEARIYAEDPARDFLPTGGPLLALRFPETAALPGGGGGGGAVRVDAGIEAGGVVGSAYDPMLAKVIAWAPDREGALRALDRALSETAVLGVTTNVSFLRGLLALPEVRAGELDTGLVERRLDRLVPAAGPPDEVLAAAALAFHDDLAAAGSGPWDVPDGWRVGGPAWTTWRLESRGRVCEVRVRGLPAKGAEVAVAGAPAVPARLTRGDGGVQVALGGAVHRYAAVRDGETYWLGRDGAAWSVTRHLLGDPGDRPGAAAAGDGVVRSPMPGTVLLLKVAQGDTVAEGQPLLIVEAMKMEHTVTAPVAGVVAELPARAGRPVEMDAVLAVVRPAEDGAR